MTETLWGVLIGGVIGSVVPILHSISEFRKWKKEKKYSLLKEKRDRREKLYDDLIAKMDQCINRGSYDIAMIATILKQCPQPVSDTFEEMMSEPAKDSFTKKSNYLNLCSKFKEDIAAIEREMESVY